MFLLLLPILVAMAAPNPQDIFPIENCKRTCFLKNIVHNPQIEVGDFTYYDDPNGVENFEKNVLYLFDFIGDKLIIGKFCQIATDVKFIMNGANHATNGISTFPFKVFQKSWSKSQLHSVHKGNTIIGNDVWIGYNATIMPGIHIGDGAIIAANAVVTKNVMPYTIVGGNPAKVIRKRFSDDKIDFLLRLAWWDWPIEKITENLDFITNGDFESLGFFEINGKQSYKNLTSIFNR